MQAMEFFSNLTPFMCESVGATIIEENYLDQIVDVFQKLEDTKSVPTLFQLLSGIFFGQIAHSFVGVRDLPKLRALFNIVKLLVLMNENGLLELMMSDQYHVQIFGILGEIFSCVCVCVFSSVFVHIFASLVC
jgi:hypothetical protein